MVGRADLLDPVALDREMVARRGLVEFGKRAWHLVEPSSPYSHNPHVDVICDHLLACVSGRAKHLVVNVPPGTGKSLWFSVFFPAWIWTIWPGFTMIYASFDIGISERDADRTLKILQSDWYQRRWPHVKLTNKVPAKRNFENTLGGFRFCTSIEANVTGRHAHIRIVDDPIKPIDTVGTSSETQSQLQLVKDWWKNTMSTRVKDPSNDLYAIIMQRLHQDDLAGFVLTDDKDVTHLRLPMRYEPETRCDNAGIGGDWRTRKGELLWPVRYPEAAVKRLEHNLGIFAEAQLQQNPTNAEGDIFKKDWLQFYKKEELPGSLTQVLSVDCTFKTTAGSDYVCLQVWGSTGVNFYLLDEWTDRLSFTETVAAIRTLLVKWPRIGAKLIEDKANGSAVIELLQKTVPGVVPVTPDGGKVARANAVSYLHKAHNVFYPDAREYSWVGAHVAEVLGFPRAKHDDRVDAETQALNYLRANGGSVWDAMAALIAREKQLNAGVALP